jgi:DNA-binding NarL/FixJ family response regulator
LLKSDDLSLMLPEAIEMVGKGGVFFSEAVRQELVTGPVEKASSLLTKRQKEIIEAIAMSPNASYAQHAANLGIAESTLRNHLTLAFRALEVNGITAAIMRCKELGIISPRPGFEGW